MALFPHDEELHPGRCLGPYELVVQVGTGGMAHVWVARHLQTGGVFALKMLMTHLAGNTAFREMFFDEARIASRIRHPNVCATYELVELDGVLTIVMEWVDGTSLLRLLRPGPEEDEHRPRYPLPFRHAVKIVAETSAGLHAAHELRGEDGQPLSVVHRDVSPHNILLTRDGRVKVTDFGVAKALGKLHMTIAGQVKGKLAYMSPEQLVGGGVDRRSDVFALGTVLYETTTGQRPFQGDHDPQVMSAIIMGNFLPPSEILAGYPPALEEIVLRAMATEPGARFATALQLRQALEGWLEETGPLVGGAQIGFLVRERCGAEVDARSEALSLPPSSLAPRRTTRPDLEPAKPMGFIGGLLAVVLGLLLGLGVLFYVREARRARAIALASTSAATAAVSASASFDAGAASPPVALPPAPIPEDVRDAGELDEVKVVVDASAPDASEVVPPPRKRGPRAAPTGSAVVPPPNPYE